MSVIINNATSCTDHKSFYDYILACFPIAISLAIGYIGLLQFRINKHKFRLDLYNRRFAVYEKTLSYFQSYYSKDSNPDSTILSEREFIRAYRESVFLFGSDSNVYKRLTEIKDTLGFLTTYERMRSEADRDMFHALEKKRATIRDPSMLMDALEKDLLRSLDFRKIENS